MEKKEDFISASLKYWNEMSVQKRLTAVILFVLLFSWFYWYEYRPAKIKKDCSWVEEIRLAQPTITQEDVRASQLEYDDCININKGRGDLNHRLAFDLCPNLLKQEAPAIPESKSYRKALSREYEFCIHEKGL